MLIAPGKCASSKRASTKSTSYTHGRTRRWRYSTGSFAGSRPLHKNADTVLSAACVCDSCKMCGPHYQDRRLRGSALLMSSERKQIDSEVCRLVGRGGAHERESLALTSAAFYDYDQGTMRSRLVTDDLPRRENRWERPLWQRRGRLPPDRTPTLWLRTILCSSLGRVP